jgi:hypothetical protein
VTLCGCRSTDSGQAPPPLQCAELIHRKRLTIQRNHNVRSTSARSGMTGCDYLAIDEKVRCGAL